MGFDKIQVSKGSFRGILSRRLDRHYVNLDDVECLLLIGKRQRALAQIADKVIGQEVIVEGMSYKKDDTFIIKDARAIKTKNKAGEFVEAVLKPGELKPTAKELKRPSGKK